MSKGNRSQVKNPQDKAQRKIMGTVHKLLRYGMCGKDSNWTNYRGVGSTKED